MAIVGDRKRRRARRRSVSGRVDGGVVIGHEVVTNTISQSLDVCLRDVTINSIFCIILLHYRVSVILMMEKKLLI